MIDILSYRHWAISEDFFNSVAPTLQEWLKTGHGLDRFVHKTSMEEHAVLLAGLLAVSDGDLHAGPMSMGFDQSIGLPVIDSGNKKVAVLPLRGVITKYGEMCSYGTKDYQAMLARANAANHIDATLIVGDSPGGAVDGTQEMATAVRDSIKPVGVFIDGVFASAAYWIGSQAQGGITANKFNSNIIGSIGTYGLYQNVSEKLAKEGIQTKIIRAKQSVKKIAANPIEPLTTELENSLIENATMINQVFIDYVQAARPNVDPSVFEADVYNNKTAKSAGLIDGIGTMQTAVNKLLETVQEKKRATSPGTSGSARASVNTIMFKSNLLSSIFGKAEKAKDEKPTAEANDTSMEAADAKAAEMEAENATLQATNASQTTKLAEHEATITSLNAKVSALEGEKATLTAEKTELTEKLAKAPTGTATTIVADPKKEATVNADGGKSITTEGKYRSQADDEVDEYVKASNQKLPLK